MKSKKAIALLLIVVLAAAGALALKRARTVAPAETAPAAAPAPTLEIAPADLATVEAGEVRRALPVTGALRAISQAVVKAKVAGDLAEVRVREGDAVRAGDLLARIDDTDSRARLDERAASLDALRAQARYAEQSRRKYQELMGRKFISETAYENYRTNAEVSAGQVQAAEAQLALARKALDDTQVRAPIAGRIAERAVQRGDKASVDTRLFTIVDLSRLELEAAVPAAEVPSLAVGQALKFTVEGFGSREFEGAVARINPATQPGTRSILIYVEVPNPGQTLKAGMFASGRLVLETRQAAARVPATALRSDTAGAYVYVVEGERVLRKPVSVGLVSEAEGSAEITQGLAPGATVVRANLGALPAGALVRPAPARP